VLDDRPRYSFNSRRTGAIGSGAEARSNPGITKDSFCVSLDLLESMPAEVLLQVRTPDLKTTDGGLARWQHRTLDLEVVEYGSMAEASFQHRTLQGVV
jgi:hypothetical protein